MWSDIACRTIPTLLYNITITYYHIHFNALKSFLVFTSPTLLDTKLKPRVTFTSPLFQLVQFCARSSVYHLEMLRSRLKREAKTFISPAERRRGGGGEEKLRGAKGKEGEVRETGKEGEVRERGKEGEVRAKGEAWE